MKCGLLAVSLPLRKLTLGQRAQALMRTVTGLPKNTYAEHIHRDHLKHRRLQVEQDLNEKYGATRVLGYPCDQWLYEAFSPLPTLAFYPEGPRVRPCLPAAPVPWYLCKEEFSSHGQAGDTTFP